MIITRETKCSHVRAYSETYEATLTLFHMSVQQVRRKVLFVLFCIHELRESYDWLVLL